MICTFLNLKGVPGEVALMNQGSVHGEYFSLVKLRCIPQDLGKWVSGLSFPEPSIKMFFFQIHPGHIGGWWFGGWAVRFVGRG